MDIAALNNTALSALNSASTPTSEAIGVAMLSNQLDVSQSMSDSLIRAMELSVNPAVGGKLAGTLMSPFKSTVWFCKTIHCNAKDRNLFLPSGRL